MDAQLITRLSRVRTNVVSINQQLEYEVNAIARHTAKIKQLEEEKAQLIKAVGTIDRCIQIVSASGIGKMEGMVSDGLQRVYGSKHIGLVIEKKETSRGNTYRILIKDGDVVGNAMDSFGGGIQNMAAFLLRVILIKRFKLAPFLALDEQFSNVSPEYQYRVAQLLKTLAGLGFTIFAVSHQAAITAGADHVYQLTVHCPKCGYDMTPQYPYIEPVPETCSNCQVDCNPTPRLTKLEGLKLEELNERPSTVANQS